MNQVQRNRYLETAVQTASPAQLLIMLYDGAIRYSRAALSALEAKNYQEAHNHLIRVQDIIHEFVITLDRSIPISENLLLLYDYFLVRLREANVRKQPEPVQEVLGYLIELKEAWMQAAKTVGSPSQTVNV